MATLLIAEFDFVHEQAGGPVNVAEAPIAEQAVTYTTATDSSAFNSNTRMIRVAAKDAQAHIKIKAPGGSGNATASSALWLPVQGWEYFAVDGGGVLSVYDGSS